MQREELLRLWRQRPFQPIRIHHTDGRVFHIRSPGLLLVGGACLVIGIPAANDTSPDPIGESVRIVEYPQIARVEPEQPVTPVPAG
jgi:hypothetical protein